jgi:hypothetical protein
MQRQRAFVIITARQPRTRPTSSASAGERTLIVCTGCAAVAIVGIVGALINIGAGDAVAGLTTVARA